MPARTVAIANRHPRLRLDRRALRRALAILDAHATSFVIRHSSLDISPGVPPGELSLVFLTDAVLAQLHADFLADPTPTDVITFASDPALGTAGEICVSADAAARVVGLPLAGTPPSITARRPAPALPLAFSAELLLYVVHGWLHLAGYDDLQPAKKRAMRRAETRALRLLEQQNCLPRFALLKRRGHENHL